MTLLSAFVTGLLGPIVLLLLNEYIKNRRLPRAQEARLKKLCNVWYGRLEQEVQGKGVAAFDVVIVYRQDGRRIGGSCEYVNPEKGTPTRLILYDGMFDGSILKIEYRDPDEHVFRKGSCVLELNDLGDAINGEFVGYSPTLKRIVSGPMTLCDTARKQTAAA